MANALSQATKPAPALLIYSSTERGRGYTGANLGRGDTGANVEFQKPYSSLDIIS
jgi:hypothetical protein